MSNLKLYEWSWDQGRGYDAEGLFVASEEELKPMLGRDIYFGEICGKHSEVTLSFDMEDFTIKSDDQGFIEQLIAIVGGGSRSISGYNPLEYFEDQRDDEEE
jgi:hypothetical protein